jgi:hypothetical protein
MPAADDIKKSQLEDLKSKRKRLRILLEDETQKVDMNIEFLIEQYKRLLPHEPIWSLIQDIHRQANIYSNILEEIKGFPQSYTTFPTEPNAMQNYEDNFARRIKEKYEKLGLVPENFLPNPLLDRLSEYVLDKLDQSSKAFVRLIHGYGSDLLQELRFQQGTTVALQVQVGWPPALTVGVERTAQL